MKLTTEQQKRVKTHAKWLNAKNSEAIYNRTIDIAAKYEPKGDVTKWLLYLANNIYINEYCNR